MTALTGNTGMRVRSRGNFNQNGPGDACTNMGSGETEDYVINILPAPDCANPTNITATSGVDSIMTTWSWAQTLLPVKLGLFHWVQCRRCAIQLPCWRPRRTAAIRWRSGTSGTGEFFASIFMNGGFKCKY